MDSPYPKSFSERFHLVASAEIMDRFLTNYDMYLKAVIDEANDSDHQTIRSSMDAYLTMRRDTGAVKCCFDLLLIAAEIPHGILKILGDHRITHIEKLGHDLICVGNVRAPWPYDLEGC